MYLRIKQWVDNLCLNPQPLEYVIKDFHRLSLFLMGVFFIDERTRLCYVINEKSYFAFLPKTILRLQIIKVPFGSLL